MAINTRSVFYAAMVVAMVGLVCAAPKNDATTTPTPTPVATPATSTPASTTTPTPPTPTPAAATATPVPTMQTTTTVMVTTTTTVTTIPYPTPTNPCPTCTPCGPTPTSTPHEHGDEDTDTEEHDEEHEESHVVKWTTPLFAHPADDIAGTILAFFSVVLGQSGGVGAGGLLVPVYIAVLRLGPFAIPLSKATITGASIFGVILTARRRHPHADRPLISYHVVLVLGPMTLAGTIIGVMLTTVFPSWLVTIFLIVLLGYTTRATWRKAKTMLKKENASRLEAQDRSRVQAEADAAKQASDTADGKTATAVPAPAPEPQQKDLLIFEMNDLFNIQEATLQSSEDQAPTPAPASGIAATSNQTYASAAPDSAKINLRLAEEAPPTDSSVVDPGESERLRTVAKILKRESKPSIPSLVVMIVSWFVVLFCALLKGGHGTESVAGIQCMSGGYWAVVILSIGIISCFAVWCSRYLNADYELKKKVNFQFVKGDVHWNQRNTLLYPFMCIFAGLAAGLLGIGAGMIQSPMMLEMGILPEISSATAMIMVLFTSSSTAVQFLLLGTLRFDYALWYGSVGMVGAIAGQYVSDIVVYKYKRVSYMVFAVSVVTGMSAAAMGIEGILEVAEDIKKHNSEDLKFHGLCA